MGREETFSKIKAELEEVEGATLEHLRVEFDSRKAGTAKSDTLRDKLSQAAAGRSTKSIVDDPYFVVRKQDAVEFSREVKKLIESEVKRRAEEADRLAKDPFHTLEELKTYLSDDGLLGSDYRALLLVVLSAEGMSAVAKVEILRLITRILEKHLTLCWQGWLNVSEGQEQEIVSQALALVEAAGRPGVTTPKSRSGSHSKPKSKSKHTG